MFLRYANIPLHFVSCEKDNAKDVVFSYLHNQDLVLKENKLPMKRFIQDILSKPMQDYRIYKVRYLTVSIFGFGVSRSTVAYFGFGRAVRVIIRIM